MFSKNRTTIVATLLFMSIVVSLVIVSAAAAAETTFTSTLSDPKVKCNKTEMDQTVRWMFFFNDPKRLLPKRNEESYLFCEEKNDKEQYINDYADHCLAQFPKQITSLMMYGISKKNRYYCAYTRGRNEFIQFATCLNSIKSGGAQCMNELIRLLIGIKNTPVKGRIGKMCCSYYRFEECLSHQAHDETKLCSPRDRQLLEELFDGYTEQMLANVCSRYPRDVDNCSKVLPKRDITKILKKVSDKETKQTYSLLPPLIDILESIPV